jgi:ATP-dependent Clp protease adapter protein ClpS
MMQRLSLLTALVALFIQGQAFMVTPPAFARAPISLTTSTTTSLFMAGQAQPEVETKTKTKVQQKEKQKQQRKKKEETDDPVQQRRDDDFEDAPMYKLVLLRDDDYDPEHVITRMCSVMEDVDEDAAKTIYQACMASGKAMVGKYPFEIAELFKEQLLRSTPMIFCDMQEE